jgi:hypothetical protein
LTPNSSQFLKVLRRGDSFAAIELLHRDKTPKQTAERFRTLLSDLYWKAHNLPAVVTIGRAGILHCLAQSLLPRRSAKTIYYLRSTAKSFAYDVGSFTWPGWDEPGIHPTPADLSAGRDCAQLNLRLAIELKKPPEKVSMAHWLIGAHALAQQNFPFAQRHFRHAIAALGKPNPQTQAVHLCNRGYLAMARLGAKPKNAIANKDFLDATSQLKFRGDPDSLIYLTELHTSRRLFL